MKQHVNTLLMAYEEVDSVASKGKRRVIDKSIEAFNKMTKGAKCEKDRRVGKRT